MRVLHVEPGRYGVEARRLIEAAGQVDYVECERQDDFVAALAQADYFAVFLRLGLALDARAMAAAPSLKWVITPTTGLDHIDLDEAVRRGLRVVSLFGETAFLDTIKSTAEHTWALLLALERRLIAGHADVMAGQWRRAPFLCGELDGRTLGVVGCGRLGRMVAGYGLAFGMMVLVHDHSTDSLGRAPASAVPVTLTELLANADVVSLHLPLNASTRGFLSIELLREMKVGALLINTARGELIDEGALLQVLREGHLAGAALDVLAGDGRWDGESPPGHPLIQYARDHHNLILSPHLGGYGESSTDRTRRFVAQRFLDALKGGAPG